MKRLIAERRESPLERTGAKSFRINVRDDEFVHFTTSDRALEIAKGKKLLMRPPHAKFGGDAVYGVSLVYGGGESGVQTKHVRGDGEIVAVRFKTTTRPKVGFVEEVVWNRDVDLKSVSVLPAPKAVGMLRKTPFRIRDDEHVEYE